MLSIVYVERGGIHENKYTHAYHSVFMCYGSHIRSTVLLRDTDVPISLNPNID